MLVIAISLGLVGIVLAIVASFLLGFRLGGSHWQTRLIRTQMQAASARRQLHDLTRQAFVAMADHVLRTEKGGRQD